MAYPLISLLVEIKINSFLCIWQKQKQFFTVSRAALNLQNGLENVLRATNGTPMLKK
jgi:hypothetical protein